MVIQENAPSSAKRAWNWQIWTGFLLALAVIPVYFVFFAKYPITRNMPWASWLMFAIAGWLLWIGVRRAFVNSALYRGKVAGPILACVEPWGRCFLWICNDVCFAPITSGGGRT